jgi:uncharacterized protein YkwD
MFTGPGWMLCCLGLVLWAGCLSSTPQEPPSPERPATPQLPAGPPLDVSTLERLLFDEVNRARAARRRRAVHHDDDLAAMAREHSQEMAAHRYLDHFDRQGQSPARRARRHGRTCEVGENLFTTLAYDSYRLVRGGREITMSFQWKSATGLARETVHGWLESPPHRATLLDPHFKRQGIGVAMAENHTVYVTQTLCP